MSTAPEQLAYVLINPYTIHKSRTGGVITRLFTRTALNLVAARMFAPSQELVNEFTATIVTAADSEDRSIQELIRQYLLDNYAPDPQTGRRRRVMLLVFRGEDAVNKVRAAVGRIDPARATSGDTIRATYGDYIVAPGGEIKYFEPAAIVAPSPEQAEEKLKIWAKYSDTDGGLLTDVVAYPAGDRPEETLVLLKPDNFRFPSGRPGNIVDMLSRTGLFIVAIKVHRMTVAQAAEFYGPVREVLRAKLHDAASLRARGAIERELGFKLPDSVDAPLGDLLGPLMAEHQFNRLVHFMTGRRLDEPPAPGEAAAGLEKIVAVAYQGVDAVRKIRNVLGPTDPQKAPPGTIRRELGQDIMVNAAHASDSVANARREMGIINIAENNLRTLVEEFYDGKP